jgi:hypothetical protein
MKAYQGNELIVRTRFYIYILIDWICENLPKNDLPNGT